METKKITSSKKVSILAIVSLILAGLNFINVLINWQKLSDWSGRYGNSYIYFLDILISRICYCIVPLLLFLYIKIKKKSLLLFSSIFFFLASVGVLFELYMFLELDAIDIILEVIPSIFIVISAIYMVLSKKNKAIHKVTCFFNTAKIVTIFSIVFPAVICGFILTLHHRDVTLGLYEELGYKFRDFDYIDYVFRLLSNITMLSGFNFLFSSSSRSAEFETKPIENKFTHVAKHILIPICILCVYFIGWGCILNSGGTTSNSIILTKIIEYMPFAIRVIKSIVKYHSWHNIIYMFFSIFLAFMLLIFNISWGICTITRLIKGIKSKKTTQPNQ